MGIARALQEFNPETCGAKMKAEGFMTRMRARKERKKVRSEGRSQSASSSASVKRICSPHSPKPVDGGLQGLRCCSGFGCGHQTFHLALQVSGRPLGSLLCSEPKIFPLPLTRGGATGIELFGALVAQSGQCKSHPRRFSGPIFTMKELLEAGVHFGHQTKRWNPKMKEYIFGRAQWHLHHRTLQEDR